MLTPMITAPCPYPDSRHHDSDDAVRCAFNCGAAAFSTYDLVAGAVAVPFVDARNPGRATPTLYACAIEQVWARMFFPADAA